MNVRFIRSKLLTGDGRFVMSLYRSVSTVCLLGEDTNHIWNKQDGQCRYKRNNEALWRN
jgi:hypothetical protein